MRFVKISQEEVMATRKLYESVMSYACHGLFHREGRAVGKEVAGIALRNPSEYFETTKNILVGRGWVEEMEFDDSTVTTRGSIEVVPGGESETCHRLRGILAMVYEAKGESKMTCTEDRCESMGAESCLFLLKPEGQ